MPRNNPQKRDHEQVDIKVGTDGATDEAFAALI
jgi:hypothetical protein